MASPSASTSTSSCEPALITGTVTLLKKAFGFIQSPATGATDIFFHSSACAPGCQFDALSRGDRVSFRLVQGPRPTAAHVVRAHDGDHVAPTTTATRAVGVLLRAPAADGAGAPGLLCFLDEGTPRQLLFDRAPDDAAAGVAGAWLSFMLLRDERLYTAARQSSSRRRHHMYLRADDVRVVHDNQQLTAEQLRTMAVLEAMADVVRAAADMPQPAAAEPPNLAPE